MVEPEEVEWNEISGMKGMERDRKGRRWKEVVNALRAVKLDAAEASSVVVHRGGVDRSWSIEAVDVGIGVRGRR